MVGSYIKKTVRSAAKKAAYFGAALTLTALSYMPSTANAQQAPRRPETSTPIEILINSYEQAYAKSKGRGIDRQILQLVTEAYQNPELPDNDRKQILDSILHKIGDNETRKKAQALAKNYTRMKETELQARIAYQKEMMKAEKTRGNNKIAILARAERALYEKLAEAESFLNKTQLSQEMLNAARRGLELSKKHPGLMLVQDFQKYIAESKQALAQAESEKHQLSELKSYSTAIEVAIEEAEAAKKPATQAQHYRDAIDLMKEAEKLFPFEQFAQELQDLEKRYEDSVKRKKKKDSAESEPDSAPEPKNDTKTPEVKTTTDTPKHAPADNPKNSLTDKADAKDTQQQGDSDFKGLSDMIEGKKYNSAAEIGGGALTEDRAGDFQHGSVKLSDILDFKFLRQYESWTNAARNNQNLRNMSALLELKPLAIPSLAFKMNPEIVNAIKVGGFVQDSSGTERQYSEDITEDSNFRVTMTENIRNIEKNIDLSAWAELQLNDFLIKTSTFYKSKDTETRTQSVTLNENLNDPSGTYADTNMSSVSDVEILRGIKALAALRLNNGVKGHIGVLGQLVEEYERLAGTQSSSKKTATFGLDAEIRTQDNTFGATAAVTQELETNGKQELTTSRGMIAAVLDISPIELAKKKTLDSIIFADAHATAPRDGKTSYGAGGGAVIGNSAQVLPQVLEWLSHKNSHKIRLSPEISDEMQKFSEKKGFRDLLLTDMKEGWGAALAAYVEVAKETGLDGKLDTTIAASLAGILDTPPAAFVLSAHYSEGILERTWGIDCIAHIKKHGFAVGAGFSQTNYLVTRQEVNGVEGYFMIPLGKAPEPDKK